MAEIQPRTAIQAAVPNTYDANRRPGSSGRRYFSDVEYVLNSEAPADQPALNLAAQGRRDAQANTLGARNAANLARQTRPQAQSVSDAQVPETLAGLTSLAEIIAAMNENNISPTRASGLTSLPYETLQQYLRDGTGEYSFSQGGIAGYAGPDGSQVQAPQKPIMGSVPKSAVGDAQIKQFAAEYSAIKGSMAKAKTAKGKMVGQLALKDLITNMGNAHATVMQYLDSTNGMVEPRTKGMAKGGIADIAGGFKKSKGRYLGGQTDGMADQIPAVIDNNQPAALSDGEFVIPADVVSHLGNGNSSAGAEQLHGMMDKIRKARTGNTEQGRQIDANKFLP